MQESYGSNSFPIVVLPPIKAGDRYRRKLGGQLVIVTRAIEHEGTDKIWFRYEDGRTIAYPNVTETWEYEQSFRIDFERVE
jgi:hypothetical protein